MYDGLDPTTTAPQTVCGFTPDDLQQVMSDLLPLGWVWPRDLDAVQQLLLAGLAVEYARIYQRDCDLLAEANPCEAYETLPDWERLLGLPDPCTGPLDTIQQRQAAACAKMAATGGASIAYIEGVLEALGYHVRITEYVPFLAGISLAGDPDYGDDWRFAWNVLVSGEQVWDFAAGLSHAGEPLRTWGDQILECTIAALAPAHTVPIISYAVGESVWDSGHSIWDDGESFWDLNPSKMIMPEARL